MPTPRDLLIAKVAAVACELSAGQAEALAYEFRSAHSPRKILHVAGQRAPREILDLCEMWIETNALDGTGLADALLCASYAIKTVSSYEKVELIYTGPDSQSLRRTLQALLEVIREARQRLWVVSYFVGAGMNDVLDAIEERAGGDVEVKILVDHLTSNFDITRQQLAKRTPSSMIYIWPEEHRKIGLGNLANLHAKCAVADGQRAFVSSANLTGWAMEYNLEAGYLVTGGPTPRSLEQHLDRLVTASTVVPA